LKLILPQNSGKTPGNVHVVQLKNRSGIRRPPCDRICRPRKDSRAVSEQESFNREISTNRDQTFRAGAAGFWKTQPMIENGDGHGAQDR
jgi:hypothetical protein